MMAERLYAGIWRQNGFPAQRSSQPAATPCPKGGCGNAALCMRRYSNRFFLNTFILFRSFFHLANFLPESLFADMQLSGSDKKAETRHPFFQACGGKVPHIPKHLQNESYCPTTAAVLDIIKNGVKP